MLNSGLLHRVLSFQLPPEAEWHDFISHFYSRYNRIHDLIMNEFGPNGFIVLFFFVVFLLIIVIIYVRFIVDTFKYGKQEEEDPEAETDGLFYTLETPELTLANDNNENENHIFDEEAQEKLQEEQELSKNLVEASKQTADYLHLEEDYIALKKKMQKHAKAEQRRRKMLERRQRRNQKTPVENIEETVETTVLNPIAAVINLLGHGVSEQKAAQALYYHYNATMSEEDVLQTIQSIRNFIGLYNTGKFNIKSLKQPLPTAAEAITHLADGDSSSCLLMLQALLNNYMKQAENEEGIIRSLTYALAASCACIMGNMAGLSDAELAHNSFELATELSPKNVDAWGRLGDMYMQKKSTSKAMIAYQNVLEIGDKILYAQQIANAKKNLAAYYFKQGMEAQAQQMQEESSRFYQTYGIVTPLSQEEEFVYKTLQSDNKNMLPEAIKAIVTIR